MIKNSSHSISKKDISVVKRVLLKQDLTQGEEILKFEKNISKFTKANYASVVNSSTSALLIACKALNLKKGDYFWTSAISFVASANCAELLGAHVGFVDISLNDFNIDIKSLEKRLKNTKKNKIPKILVVVHYAGNSCNMKEIYKLSKIYGFKIIEDSCHALGGSYLSYRIGSCKYSHISTFSFHAIKNICAGEGGAITTNYNWIKKRVDFFRSHGILKKKNHVSWMYDQVNIG
jgi:dTDP-4-amino-4,6-dideoxygalactose transaminase